MKPVFVVHRSDELYHYGVKGMKWDQSKRTLTVTDENTAKKIMSQYGNNANNSSGKSANTKTTDKNTDTAKEKTTDKIKDDKSKTNNADTAKIVDQVINGKFGNGQARVSALKKSGYDYNKIQNLVNEKLLGKAAAKRIAERKKRR